MKKFVFVLSVFFVLTASFFAVFVHASQVFTVPPLSEKTVSISLNQGESVNGSFSVTGGTGTGVDFLATDPNGKELLSYNFTSYESFSFTASVAGPYTLSFDNSFCSCVGGKNVILDYSVGLPVNATVSTNSEVSSAGGLPAIAVIVLVVVVLSLAAVVFFVRRSRLTAARAKNN